MTTFIVAVAYLGTDPDPHWCTPAAASKNAPTTWPPKPSSINRNPATFRGASASRYRSAAGTAPPSSADAPAAPTSHRPRRRIAHAHPHRHHPHEPYPALTENVGRRPI